MPCIESLKVGKNWNQNLSERKQLIYSGSTFALLQISYKEMTSSLVTLREKLITCTSISYLGMW